MKKIIFTLFVGFLATSGFAQDLKMPKSCGIAGVDRLRTKVVAAYRESESINKELNAISVDGTTIKNMDADMDPDAALKSLERLSERIAGQEETATELVGLKEEAAASLKKANALKKVKGAKTMKDIAKVEKELAKNTKTQAETLAAKTKAIKNLM